MSELTKQQVLNELVGILKDMTSDWEIDDFSGEISGDTSLVADLSFESIEIVQLMVTIEQHFTLKNLASEELLMRDGRYVPDRTVNEVAEFVYHQIQKRK
ncbi:MAG TPA: acyl carrier protein [Kiritimatiellia bacterium]|mgnify:CR=1 FL=1|nr:acyl carrier protein [Kiritimatiellia bacterium]